MIKLCEHEMNDKKMNEDGNIDIQKYKEKLNLEGSYFKSDRQSLGIHTFGSC